MRSRSRVPPPQQRSSPNPTVSNTRKTASTPRPHGRLPHNSHNCIRTSTHIRNHDHSCSHTSPHHTSVTSVTSVSVQGSTTTTSTPYPAPLHTPFVASHSIAIFGRCMFLVLTLHISLPALDHSHVVFCSTIGGCRSPVRRITLSHGHSMQSGHCQSSSFRYRQWGQKEKSAARVIQDSSYTRTRNCKKKNNAPNMRGDTDSSLLASNTSHAFSP